MAAGGYLNDPYQEDVPGQRWYSIYCNVTTGTSYSRALTQSLIYVINLDREWNLTRSFSQPLTIGINNAREWNLTRAFSQTLDFTFNTVREWNLTRVMTLALETSWSVWRAVAAGAAHLRSLTLNLITTFNAYRDTVPTFKRVLDQLITFSFTVDHLKTLYTGWTWLNVLVENSLGNPVASAVVSLWNSTSGLLIATETTNSTGYIVRQNVTLGNFTIQAIASTYENYMERFTVTPNLLKEIVLTLTVDVMGFNMELLVLTGLSGAFMFIGWFDDLEKGLVASYISFFLWFATGLWWLWDKSPAGTMDFFYIFEMLALVALMMGIYKTMTLGSKMGKKGVSYD
jgi:hypothetical protein